MKTLVLQLRVVLLGCGVLLLLGFLLWKTRAIDTDAHGRFTDDLRKLKQLDINLNQDLLKIRNGLLANYDSIADTLDKLKVTRERLTPPPPFISEQGRNELGDLLTSYTQVLTDKENAIERLKTSSATLKNSLDYLPKLIQETAKKAAAAPILGELSPLLNDILHNILIYNLNGDEQRVASLTEQLAILTQNRDRYATALGGPATARIATHVQAILKYKPQVDTLLQEAIILPTVQRTDALAEAYATHYEQVLGAANRYRRTLYVLIFALLGYIGYTILRLQKIRLALGASEDRMARVMRATDDGIWDWDVQTGEVYYSPRFKAQLGYEEQEFANLLSTFDAHLHADDRELVQQALQNHFTQRTQYHLEFRLRTKDNEYIWIDAYGQATWDSHGTPVRMSGTHRDISERKQTEEQLRESVSVLSASTSQIMTTLQQLVTSTTETTSAIAQTAATMEEVKQTVSLASEQAHAVSASTAQTAQVTHNGEQAVEQAITGLQHARTQMESIAHSVVKLGEQSRTISDIIEAVNDLTEQSNLLAVNAAIEAAKAGEQGKGFAVVAQEVKTLARQSKQATAQVQTILNDIQKAANVAVLVTEQGTQSVEAGISQSIEANQSIRTLAKGITEATHAVNQIAHSSQQQMDGIDQVAAAMVSVRHASAQNLDGIQNIKASVQQLHAVGQTLQTLVERYTARNTAPLTAAPPPLS